MNIPPVIKGLIEIDLDLLVMNDLAKRKVAYFECLLIANVQWALLIVHG
jgi:hypothetical protein